MPEKKKAEDIVSSDLNEIRNILREEAIKRYGGVREFLRSEDGQKLGGMNIRPYLYDKGPVSIKVLRSVCSFFGFGKITRKLVVTRTYKYVLHKP